MYARMKDMPNAAARINTGWTYHTIAMFQVAINPIPPPTSDITWQSMLPMATRNLRRFDEALWQAELSRSLTTPLYPKQGPSANHQHALYELGMAFAKCKLFGSMRAGASTFPYSTKDCPACGHITHNTTHMMRSCKSTKQLLNTWLQQVAPSVGAGRMSLSEVEFCAVYLRPWEHSHETRSTSNGQLRVGCYTSGDTISYMPKKRQLSECGGTAMPHVKVLWVRIAAAGDP